MNKENKEFTETVIVEYKDIKPIICNAYFKAEISTKLAAKILNTDVAKFVEIFEEWSEDSE